MLPGISAVIAAAAVSLCGYGHVMQTHHDPHLPPGQPVVMAPEHIKTGDLKGAEKLIFEDLVSGGFTRQEAAGIEANADAESTLNVENHAMDTNGYRGYGLLSWNAHGYPGAVKLVTGNERADLARQIGFLQNDTERTAEGLQGRTAFQVGGNFSYWVEGCVNCQPGGHQWTLRATTARAIYASAER